METVVIRKYANRRLYDTSSGRYVNLDDVAALVRKGADVQVVDAKTGEDLTRVVLTQIIVEDAREQPTGLPLELLRQLIMVTDRAGQEFIMWYLKSAFDAYHKVRETVQTGLASPFSMVKSLLSPGESEVEQLRRRVAELEAKTVKGRRK
jgi:polyhydroxyalkanoate synthesis repressor PhaR